MLFPFQNLCIIYICKILFQNSHVTQILKKKSHFLQFIKMKTTSLVCLEAWTGGEIRVISPHPNNINFNFHSIALNYVFE